MHDKEQLRLDALRFLRENATAVVATSFNDEPQASTVYFYTDDDFNFYFMTKRNTSKYINIEMNPKVAIVVGTGPEHITVQATGTAELLSDEEERQRIGYELTNIRAREHVKVWPIEEIEKFKDRSILIFKIAPKKVIFMNLDSAEHPESMTDNTMVEVFSAPE